MEKKGRLDAKVTFEHDELPDSPDINRAELDDDEGKFGIKRIDSILKGEDQDLDIEEM